MSIDLSYLDHLIDGLPETVADALDDAAVDAAEVARGHTKGALAKGIGLKRTGLFSWLITTDKPYAEFIENGRPAIVAAPGKCLRFEVNGTVLFRKRVGPAAAQPFLAPAGDWFDAHAAGYVERALARL